MLIRTEQTPNPATRKFLPGQTVMEAGTRDFADAGWHLGELVMPLMILVIVVMILNIQAVQVYAFIVLWAYIAFVVIDMAILSIRLKRAARRKFGESRLERGLGWYGAMRTMQMRWMRLPKPQVRRGHYPS